MRTHLHGLPESGLYHGRLGAAQNLQPVTDVISSVLSSVTAVTLLYSRYKVVVDTGIIVSLAKSRTRVWQTQLVSACSEVTRGKSKVGRSLEARTQHL